MSKRYIYTLAACGPHIPCGQKARNLAFLRVHRFRVPKTYVCVWDAFDQSVQNRDALKKQLQHEIAGIIRPGKAYAVRSSSNLEDGKAFSHAGIFATVLNVQGIDAVLDAVNAIRDSTRSARVSAYLRKAALEGSRIHMAVIIQEMVHQQCSGVIFTRNPTNGKNETIVEAVTGSGELLVQGGITPWRWICKDGVLCTSPPDAPMPERIIQRAAREAKKIEKFFGAAADLEWVYDGKKLYWVQVRALTGMETPDSYTRRFAKEFLPGSIKPLVWSVNTLIVNKAWKRLLKALTGEDTIEIERMGKLFYYRAYFNIGVIGNIFEQLGFSANILDELLFADDKSTGLFAYRLNRRSVQNLPRLAAMLLRTLFFGRGLRPALAQAQADYARFDGARLELLAPKEIIAEAESLLKLMRTTAYENIIAHVMMYVYTRLLDGRLRKYGCNSASIDMGNGSAELHRYQPVASLAALHARFAELPPEAQARLRTCTYESFLELDGTDDFREAVKGFLVRFGHLSDSSNDFSLLPWRENPQMVLRMITEKHVSADQHKKRLCDLQPQSLLVQFLYNRARTFTLYKEATSSLMTYGYGMIRDRVRALGRSCAAAGAIASGDDIFYLYFDEVRALVKGRHPEGNCAKEIACRKQDMERYQHKKIPEVIYGDREPPVVEEACGQLTGIAASGGYYSGAVRVITGIKDLHKMREGDVLVIPHSDVGLMPLFTKAGAIISESGGLLSHSSIIAREFRIPAVLSVQNACSLADDTVVTVNGFEGKVIIHDTQGCN